MQLSDIPTEIVVVDNCSTDASHRLTTQRVPLRILELDSNLGFPFAVNFGVRSCLGNKVLLLNPDATLSEPELRTLLLGLEFFGPRALIGGTVNSGSFRFSALPAFNYRNLVLSLVAPSFMKPPSIKEVGDGWSSVESGYIQGSCMLMSKSSFEKLGGLKELFWIEDADFCERARSTGHGLFVSSNVQIEHEGTYSKKSFSRIVLNRQLVSKSDYALYRFGFVQGLPITALVLLLSIIGWITCVVKPRNPGLKEGFSDSIFGQNSVWPAIRRRGALGQPIPR
jgi:N-acetylglucosaminyl-diphospho-decaprenol L-rhamnosyltransferase